MESAPTKVNTSHLAQSSITFSRFSGFCDNNCTGNGICVKNINCQCFLNLNGDPAWTGPDCSLKTCPKDIAWVGGVVGSQSINRLAIQPQGDMHAYVECSNRGLCDRSTGFCSCFSGYDGLACQRSLCPGNCNGKGRCYHEKLLASFANRNYSDPWDSTKQVLLTIVKKQVYFTRCE